MQQQAPVTSFGQPSRERHQPFHAEMQIVGEPVPCGNLLAEQYASYLALRRPGVQPIERTERQDQSTDPLRRKFDRVGAGSPVSQYTPEPQRDLDTHLEQGVERQDDGDRFDPRRGKMQAKYDTSTLDQEFTNSPRRQADEHGGKRRVIRISQTGREIHQSDYPRQHRSGP